MTTDTLTKPAPRASAGRRRRPLRKIDAAMRQRIEEAITRMIDALDALDAPGEDLEDDDPGGGDDDQEGDGEADDEPSLGAPEHFNLGWAWGLGFGARDDTEIELGSPGVTLPNDQTYREAAFGDRDGREDETSTPTATMAVALMTSRRSEAWKTASARTENVGASGSRLALQTAGRQRPRARRSRAGGRCRGRRAASNYALADEYARGPYLEPKSPGSR